MNRALARTLAERGNRVILPDFLGHGQSDKPTRASNYRMDAFGREMVALLDHLDIDKAVIGGVSLGAGVSLQMAVNAPERVEGLVLEMPVLEWAVPAAAMVFVPLLLAMHYASGPMGALTRLAGRLPVTGNDALDSVLAAAANEPPVITAILHGILTGPVAPTVEERAAIDVPALVIAHGRDLIHPFSDAAALAELLPQGQLVPARSMLEFRARPQRLTDALADFLDDTWASH
jgi:pimeloyl-ACP methyl ester carboxylesterase